MTTSNSEWYPERILGDTRSRAAGDDPPLREQLAKMLCPNHNGRARVRWDGRVYYSCCGSWKDEASDASGGTARP
jgi:hypothetical protein